MENNFFKKNQLTLRGIMVGFIILVLMIPMANISSLVQERQNRQTEVSQEVSNKWASNQTINGPVLIIPYIELSLDQKNTFRKLAYFLPSDLNAAVLVTPQTRHRSIFDIVVYQSKVIITGKFDSLNISTLNIPTTAILWNEAFICLGLTDFRGLEDQINIIWDTQQYTFEVGAPMNDFIPNGLKVNIPYHSLTSSQHSFSLELGLRGSQNLSFVPTGKTTKVHMESSWPDPSFTGAFLPTDQAQITEQGFKADWKILDLNRNFPQSFKDTKYEVHTADFGVNFLKGSDHYSKTTRSVKYALLFIGLTLALYYFIEILQQKEVHAFQYVLVGLALCVFYTLLLSISEYLNFNWAYLIAAGSIVLLVTWYTTFVFKSKKIAGTFSLVLTLLYGFIFILIQLQDWALLIGSVGLFVVLAAVMYFSKRINFEKAEL
ncbi:MAG: cell envelope integrity protein CreD [Saprospiraceae bacterium]